MVEPISMTAAAGAATGAMSKAMGSLAAVKKPTWAAMDGAMKATKQAEGAMQSVMGSFKSVFNVFKPLAILLKPFEALIKVMSAAFSEALMPSMGEIIELLTSDEFMAAAMQIGRALGEAIVPAMHAFVGVLKVVELLLPVVVGWFKLGGAVLGGLATAFKNWITTLMTGWYNILYPIMSLMAALQGKSIPYNPPNKLANGGLVTQPTLALIGEAGPERVTPLDQEGRGRQDAPKTYNINVRIDNVMDSEHVLQLARKMREVIFYGD